MPRLSPPWWASVPSMDSSLNRLVLILPLALKRPDREIDSVLSLTVDAAKRLSMAGQSSSAQAATSMLWLRAVLPALE